MLAEALLAVSSRVHHTPCFPHHASQLCLPPNSSRFKHGNCQAVRKEGSLQDKSQREILSHGRNDSIFGSGMPPVNVESASHLMRCCLIGHLKIQNSRPHTQIVYQIASRVLGQFFPLSYTCSWHIYVQCRQANSSISLSKTVIRNTCCCCRKNYSTFLKQIQMNFPPAVLIIYTTLPFQ